MGEGGGGSRARVLVEMPAELHLLNDSGAIGRVTRQRGGGGGDGSEGEGGEEGGEDEVGLDLMGEPGAGAGPGDPLPCCSLLIAASPAGGRQSSMAQQSSNKRHHRCCLPARPHFQGAAPPPPARPSAGVQYGLELVPLAGCAAVVHVKGDCAVVEAIFPSLWRASAGEDFLDTDGGAGMAGTRACRGRKGSDVLRLTGWDATEARRHSPGPPACDTQGWA